MVSGELVDTTLSPTIEPMRHNRKNTLRRVMGSLKSRTLPAAVQGTPTLIRAAQDVPDGIVSMDLVKSKM